MAFELRQLRHFTTVVRVGTIGGAAAELNMTQPALSKSIRLLEETLQVRLLERGSLGVTPTEFGTRLKSYADLVLTLASEAQEEIDALRGVRRGHLYIGGSSAVVGLLLPEVLLEFHKRHPSITVLVREGLSDTLLDMLQSGRLDLAITARPAETLNPDIDYINMLEEPLWIVASPDHPLAQRKTVTMDDLARFAWVVPPRPDPDRLRLDALFTSSGLDRPRIAFETTSTVFLTTMLARSDHLSYFPRSGFVDERQSGYGFVRLPLEGETWTRTLSAVFRRSSTMRPTVQAFIADFQQSCAHWPAED